jgi:hypothetical protein
VWQIWNEQNSPKYYAPKVKVGGYAKLVKAASEAIKSVDPEAEVMLGGMWGPESLKRGKKKPPVTTYIDYMKQLYRVPGIKRAYRKLERKRRAFRLRGVYWYSWRDQAGGEQICAWCGYAGLRNVDGTAKPAWDTFVRLANGG